MSSTVLQETRRIYVFEDSFGYHNEAILCTEKSSSYKVRNRRLCRTSRARRRACTAESIRETAPRQLRHQQLTKRLVIKNASWHHNEWANFKKFLAPWQDRHKIEWVLCRHSRHETNTSLKLDRYYCTEESLFPTIERVANQVSRHDAIFRGPMAIKGSRDAEFCSKLLIFVV